MDAGNMEGGMPALGVVFEIGTRNSFDELAQLKRATMETEGAIVTSATRIENATGNMVDVRPAINELKTFAAAAVQSESAIEKSAERMAFALKREIDTFGMSKSEMRNYRLEQKALAAEAKGLTQVASDLRAVGAELNRLEAQAGGAAGGVRKTGGAMAALAPQAQDMFTQVSMGTNVLNVLAMQGSQAAGQMAHLEGAAGKFGTFMMGPWGIALTAATFAAGALTKGLFDGASAAEAKEKAAKDLTAAIDTLADSTRGAIQTEWESQRATLASAGALRQKALDARTATMEEIAHTRAKLAAAVADSARADPSRGQDGGIDFALARAGQLDAKIKGLDKQLADQQKQLGKTEVTFRNAQIGLMGSAITARLDVTSGVTRAYEKTLARINGEFQRTGDVQAYTTARAGLERQYRAEQEAITAASKAGTMAERQRKAELRERAKEEREAAREALKDVRTRMKAEEDLRKSIAKGFASPEFTVIGNAEASKRATEQARTVFKQAFGDGDLLGDQIGGYNEALAAKWSAAAEAAADKQAGFNSELRTTALLASDLGTSLAGSFGKVGASIGDAIAVLGRYGEEQARIAADVEAKQITAADGAKLTANAQLNGMLDLTHAARGLFKEHSKGAQAMMAAEKALTVVQLARTAVDVAGGAARMFASLGPFAFPAVAAMVGVMASLGFNAGGSSASFPKANTGTGTVLGDRSAQSESIKRSIDQLRDVDTLMLSSSREMAASLRSIDGQIGGLASVLVRSANIDADAGVMQGFKTNAIGSVLKATMPIFGGVLSSLFGTKTNVIGSGLFQGGRSIEDILSEGFAAQTYSDVEKTKKFLGITTGKSKSTVYGGAADAAVNDQFTLILRGFNDAIVSAAKPLGETTDAIASRVGGFVFTLGKVDLKDLTGEQVQEKLTAVFGAAADQMAASAFPGFERFAKVGEGMFETLVRVSSTVEAVTASFDLLGLSARGLGIDAKVGLAGQFESVGAMTSAADAYFAGFYDKAEQTAAQTARMTGVFASLGMVMPSTLAGFRNLVDAQDLATTAGQATYATLLKLAPAFADLQSAMSGAKSAADIMAERTDLERRILELNGDTAAIRALDLAKVDASNRALQSQVWAIQDAQEAAKAAADLSDAWAGVGKTIEDEVRRIRGLTAADTGAGFAVLQGQFNAALAAGRAGDMDAAKSLPGLSQALLKSAEDVATSRQELDRVRAQTAASLESAGVVIAALAKGNPLTSAGSLAAAAMAAQAAAPGTPTAGSDNQAAMQALRDELAGLRREMAAGLGSIASSAARSTRILEDVTAASGGEAVAVGQAA